MKLFGLFLSMLFASTSFAQTATAKPPGIQQERVVRIAAARRSQGVPVYVDPRSYSGLSMWFDASDTSTITGSPVSQWNDKSGNNFHLVQPTAGQRPTTGAVVNTRNCISFHGDTGATSQWMYVAGVTNTPNTVIVVFKSATATWADWDGIFSWRSSSSDKVSNSASSGGVYGKNGTALVYTTGTATGVKLNGLDGNLTSFNDFNTGIAYGSGITVANATYYTDDISPGGSNNFVVGADAFGAVGARHANGDLCEIIVYNRALEVIELLTIHTSLYVKWLATGGGGD